ncbi:MAG TPA: hypothetical protein VE870_08345 [Bacteroidales bacterium]|nr:hypothetical protein [Bacteroidales bacterium]
MKQILIFISQSIHPSCRLPASCFKDGSTIRVVAAIIALYETLASLKP